MSQLAEGRIPSHRAMKADGQTSYWFVRLFGMQHEPIWVNALEVSTIAPVTADVVGPWAKCQVVSYQHGWLAYSEDDPDTTAERFLYAALH